METQVLSDSIKVPSASDGVGSVDASQRHPKIALNVKRLAHFKGDLPKYETSGASGFDVRAQLQTALSLAPGERVLAPTGLSFEVPHGYELQARARSGLAFKKGLGLVNAPGTIDADYRGEVKIILVNFSKDVVIIEDQERIAQLVLCPVVQAEFSEIKELSETQRGAGGFGSTGTL
ncbi:MAG: dUTP diphosphatase [Bdellovibrionales bacterium CG10_big_fil_rev_8_21_14_0_10_45_34]|nr:MAG: dUTP diphosphatase [Bdellovibrionales bacterium CG10_big_fil_rev_8_21_14_0_10_45_34]